MKTTKKEKESPSDVSIIIVCMFFHTFFVRLSLLHTFKKYVSTISYEKNFYFEKIKHIWKVMKHVLFSITKQNVMINYTN